MTDDNKSPAMGEGNTQFGGRNRSIRDWWPNQLNLKVLHQHSPIANPMGK